MSAWAEAWPCSPWRTARLLGGGLMVNVYGWVKGATGSFALALLPLVGLSVLSVAILLFLSRKSRTPAATVAATAQASGALISRCAVENKKPPCASRRLF
ncbi:hypothetical protein J2S30_003384 [Herbaspirillum rubrisubalbicans]|nr:hypothetical protein [Herbaspirillum rubrisubalbicans]